MKGSKKQSQGSEFSVPGMDLGQLERLLSFMTQHGLEEFEYAHGDLRIRLKKAAAAPGAAPSRTLPAATEFALPGTPARAEATPAESVPAASSESATPAPMASPAGLRAGRSLRLQNSLCREHRPARRPLPRNQYPRRRLSLPRRRPWHLRRTICTSSNRRSWVPSTPPLIRRLDRL